MHARSRPGSSSTSTVRSSHSRRAPPEGRTRPGIHAPTRSARPRRADGRVRPVDPADVLRARHGGQVGGGDDLLSSHVLPEVSTSPIASLSFERDAWSWSPASRSCALSRRARRCDVRRLPLVVAFAGIAGVRALQRHGKTSSFARGRGRRAREGTCAPSRARDRQPCGRTGGDLPQPVPIGGNTRCGVTLPQDPVGRETALVWWSLGLIGMSTLMIAVYPTVRDNPDLKKMVRGLPEAIKAFIAFGGELD